jgi:hypothetical protein
LPTKVSVKGFPPTRRNAGVHAHCDSRADIFSILLAIHSSSLDDTRIMGQLSERVAENTA